MWRANPAVARNAGLMPKLRQVGNESERQTLQNSVTAADQQIDALVGSALI